MFVLRSVALSDLDDLYELSGKVTFINLPHDKEIIRKKITSSVECFKKPKEVMAENYYFFVLEDTTINKVIGVSMIHAQHGTEHEPHFYLTVSNEHKFSKTINTGFVHGTLKLGLESDGPTEIGGLVVDPDYRGNPKKLGKQISFIRFLYMAGHQNRFKKLIHSELMPPLDNNGNSLLWEGLGRRFMNMDYAQADVLSRSNKEFILSLFPSENIYMTLLSPEVRNSIGKVGNDTLPVKKMLEKIGFNYTNEVDPFDGGPHYRAKLEDVSLIQDYREYQFSSDMKDDQLAVDVLINFSHKDYEFFALKTSVHISHEDRKVFLNSKIVEKYNINEGEKINFIPC